MKIRVLQVGPIGTNCYLLEDENTHTAAVVEMGVEDTVQMLGFRSEKEFPNAFEAWTRQLHPEDEARVLSAYEAVVEDMVHMV